MLHGPLPARQTLAAYLHDIKAGAAPGLLAPRLERALPDAETALKAHFRGWRK